MVSFRVRLTLVALGASLLVGCGWVDKLIWSQMGQDVVVAAKPLQLGPKPITLTPEPALQVRGESSDLCFALADGVTEERTGDDFDVKESQLLHGAKIHALLHDDNGKTYPWTCGGWRWTPVTVESKVGRLYSCALRECNAARPPKGAQITSIDVSATKELRVLAITWDSTDAFDHVDKH